MSDGALQAKGSRSTLPASTRINQQGLRNFPMFDQAGRSRPQVKRSGSNSNVSSASGSFTFYKLINGK